MFRLEKEQLVRGIDTGLERNGGNPARKICQGGTRTEKTQEKDSLSQKKTWGPLDRSGRESGKKKSARSAGGLGGSRIIPLHNTAIGI